MLLIVDYPYNKFGLSSFDKDDLLLLREEGYKSLLLDMKIYNYIPTKFEYKQPQKISGSIIHYIVVITSLLKDADYLELHTELTERYYCIGRYPHKEYLKSYQLAAMIEESKRIINNGL